MVSGELWRTCADHRGPSKLKPLRSSSVAMPPSSTCRPVRSSCCKGVMAIHRSVPSVHPGRDLLIHSEVVRGRLGGAQPGTFQPVNILSNRKFGEWLSLVEHLVRDQGVGGSNPLSPTILVYSLALSSCP